MITQDELKKILHYDPLTGIWTWLVSRQRVRKGAEAGCNAPGKCTTYRVIATKGMGYLAHRLAFLYMLGTWPKGEVDHETGCGLDNWWSNLRDVDNATNSRNTRRSKANTSGCTGVSWHAARQKWRVEISCGYVGSFLKYDNAVKARKAAEVAQGYHANHGEIRTG